jgi:hypothetical protein
MLSSEKDIGSTPEKPTLTMNNESRRIMNESVDRNVKTRAERRKSLDFPQGRGPRRTRGRTPGRWQEEKAIGNPLSMPEGLPHGRAKSCMRTRINEAFFHQPQGFGSHIIKKCKTISAV